MHKEPTAWTLDFFTGSFFWFLIINERYNRSLHKVMYILLLITSLIHFILLWRKGYTNLISKILFGLIIFSILTLTVLGIILVISGFRDFGSWVWVLECTMFSSIIWWLPVNLLDPKFQEFW